jgi:hypothetical protein
VQDIGDLHTVKIFKHMAGVHQLGAIVSQEGKSSNVVLEVNVCKIRQIYMRKTGDAALTATKVNFHDLRLIVKCFDLRTNALNDHVFERAGGRKPEPMPGGEFCVGEEARLSISRLAMDRRVKYARANFFPGKVRFQCQRIWNLDINEPRRHVVQISFKKLNLFDKISLFRRTRHSNFFICSMPITA